MKKHRWFITFLILCYSFTYSQSQIYNPTKDKTEERPTPQWFNDAKLGIFVHWGLYSVPAWATPTTTPDKVTDWKEFYRSNPYAEWYLNSLRIDGSPTQHHHEQTYGKDFNYYSFNDSLIMQSASWNADSWTKLFAQIGARYVVFTTKHHDGYTMYPSKVQNPMMSGSQINSPRDFVGEFCLSARKHGLKFGTYYSGGLDWTFNQAPVTNLWPDLFDAMPKSHEYANYVDAHLYEIIRNYTPDILWNDVNYPKNGNLPGIVSELFRLNPQAVVNDRWQQHPELTDFITPEYTVMDSIVEQKWETCRGIGYSFGYNKIENDEHLLSSSELIHLLIDVVSKNGNLLLNIGPRADGSIPLNQMERLQNLGKWMDYYKEGIYATHPWIIPAFSLKDGTNLRFTQKGNNLFVFFLNKPKNSILFVPDLFLNRLSQAHLYGETSQEIELIQKIDGVEIVLPENVDLEYAGMVKITNIIN